MPYFFQFVQILNIMALEYLKWTEKITNATNALRQNFYYIINQYTKLTAGIEDMLKVSNVIVKMKGTFTERRKKPK